MASVAIHECAQLPLHAVKGQLLELVWPKELPPLRYALNSVGYVLQHRPDRCLVGSTFEHAFKDEAPNLELAKAEILPKIAAFLPDLGRAEVVGCTAGLRASTPNHLPLAQKVGDKTWILTGLGSKGLLYHALLGSEIAAQLC
ncbi:MAG: FAD-dependent oxidoreductase [Chlamydiia bacterium]|nr:FAD-dependent oxidoreductase [Chlamydiia bacterium]